MSENGWSEGAPAGLGGLNPSHLLPPSFALNLGKDDNNMCLHFNPRFNIHGDINTIVCNSKDGGAWGAEQRETAFPFQPGSVAEVGSGPGPGARGWVGWGRAGFSG